MKQGTKILSVTILIIISMIAGCIFLMRGCLSKYDEYSQFGEAQGFHNKSGNYIVYLKEFYKVSSYSSDGGMTNIGGSTYYYLETRDAATLKLLKSTQFEDLDDPGKSRPHIIGRDDNLIWIFQDKIMAFDPFTQEKVCTSEKLEQLNPGLKDNLPDDIQYYTYNYILGRLEITTKNALHFQISKSFKAQKIEMESDESDEITELKAQVKKIEEERIEKQKKKSLTNEEYWKLNDTIRNIEEIIRKKSDELRNNKEYYQKIQESRARGFNYAYDKLGNAATIDTLIYALLTEKELKENSNNFSFRKTYTEDVQRSLYQATYKDVYKSSGMPSNCKVSGWKQVNNNMTFLKGGFLESKENLKTIELGNPQSWLILSAKEVGDKSKLILQRINTKGIAVWTKELPIINFSDMVFAGENLVLLSNDGEKITGSDKCNWIISMNLKTGDFVMIDLEKKEQ